MNLNKCFFGGNLTRDPELRYTTNGKPIAVFGLAINHRWTTDAGEKKEDVTFIDCEAWQRTAEVIAQYFRKGSPIFLECRVKLERWEDQQTRSKTKFVVESFQFCGDTGKGGDERSERNPPPRERSQAQADAPAGQAQADAARDDDNVPFHHPPPERMQKRLLGLEHLSHRCFHPRA